MPAFDRTEHRLSNIVVTVTGDRAVSRSDVVADHWLGDAVWHVAARTIILRTHDCRVAHCRHEVDGDWRRRVARSIGMMKNTKINNYISVFILPV